MRKCSRRRPTPSMIAEVIVSSPALTAALDRWQSAAGPYWPFVCAAPLLAAHHSQLGTSRSAPGSAQLVRTVGQALNESPTAFIVDLPPTPSVASAAALVALGLTVVPVIQRWPAPRAVLEVARLQITLVQQAVRVQQPELCRGVAFLLDGERAGRSHPGNQPGPTPFSTPSRFDNRYWLSPDRLPSAEFLLAQGIHRVCWVSPSDVAVDLRTYHQQLNAAGIANEWIPCTV
jgi:hypothetical protein